MCVTCHASDSGMPRWYLKSNTGRNYDGLVWLTVKQKDKYLFYKISLVCDSTSGQPLLPNILQSCLLQMLQIPWTFISPTFWLLKSLSVCLSLTILHICVTPSYLWGKHVRALPLPVRWAVRHPVYALLPSGVPLLPVWPGGRGSIQGGGPESNNVWEIKPPCDSTV